MSGEPCQRTSELVGQDVNKLPTDRNAGDWMLQTEYAGHSAGGGVENAEGAVVVGHDEPAEPGEDEGELPGVCELFGPG